VTAALALPMTDSKFKCIGRSQNRIAWTTVGLILRMGMEVVHMGMRFPWDSHGNGNWI